MTWVRAALVATLLLAPAVLAAQPVPPDPTTADMQSAADKADQDKKGKRGDTLNETPEGEAQIHELRHAAERLPIAAALASVLALRPRRRGTPQRQTPVIETQILLAVVGAVVMLVVGSSLARAFGIVGAAGLVRYRSKIEDPKDAGVMLCTLAIGLAAGVGLWALALFGTGFILVVLWIIESFEPKATHVFTLKVHAKDPAAIKHNVEQMLARRGLGFELRAASKDEISYDVKLPLERKTDALSEQLMKLDPEAAVTWEEKKEKK
jgi:uncharacterized protein DUF4956/MgtC family protein